MSLQRTLVYDSPPPPAPLRLRLVKVSEVQYPVEQLRNDWAGFMGDMAAARRERQALRELPQRIGRKGRKRLRARMLAAGHYKHEDNKPSAFKVKFLWQKSRRTYPYPRHKKP